ncbi:MAG: DUF4965 domain-containing protein [Clostridia bacterium]|nr:DUF4965 domain-containing protein [Clostridia bacterium]
MKLRAPSIPLITIDPYFSVWSRDEIINFYETEHWTNKPNNIIGTVFIDDKEYLFLGYDRDILKLEQKSIDIDAFSSTVVMENDIISLNLKFTSPVLINDLELLTRPVSYLEVDYKLKDSKNHNVKIDVRVSDELCLDEAGQNDVVKEEVKAENLIGMKMGNVEQKPLNKSGDDIRIDWGYVYLLTNGKNAVTKTSDRHGKEYIHTVCDVNENEETLFFFAYDDIESIEYFKKPLKSYWNRNGKTVLEAVKEANDDYKETLKRCNEFSEKLYSDAVKAGGEKYAELLLLAYRQVMAAHKLVLDENGEILYVSKECNSNGCAVTVDVSYPSTPLFLLYNPELVKGMMRPIYKYAESDEWTFDFAPHDVGQYPLVNGQVYGENKLIYQMPVEECGNMLVMETNVALATKSTLFAESHIETLEKWCKYLIEFGADPGNQLCTDDFAGHLEHNCNLSLKAIMGLRGMAIIMEMSGDKEKASFYKAEAEKMAENWLKTAVDENGESLLAFDRPGTFSMKYNMVWDKVWGTGLFSQQFMDNELKNNKKYFNKYGMPLDSRADYTKSDWLVWVASMASDKKTFEDFIEPLWLSYNDSTTRVAMTDWYDTKSGNMVSFKHRTVQGGLFMKILMEKEF